MQILYTVLLITCVVIYMKLRCPVRSKELFETPNVILHAVNNHKMLELAKLYKVIECDARITKDGVVVLLHDGTVQSVKISELTLDQIKLITGIPVLTLQELLQQYLTTNDNSRKVIIDIKTWNTELIKKIAEVLTQENKWESVVLSSFHPFVMMYIKYNYPEVKTCYMWCKNCIDYFDETNDEVTLPKMIDFKIVRQSMDKLYYWTSPFIAVMLKVDLVGIEDIDINSDIVDYFKNKGISVYAWNWKLRSQQIELQGKPENINDMITKYGISICR